jgi:hypothetical protein
MPRTLRAAYWGAFLFSLLTLCIWIGSQIWGSGTGSDLGPELFLGLSFLVSAPTFWIDEWTGLSHWLTPEVANSIPTVFVVNSLLGAAMFAALSLMAKLLKRILTHE